MEKKDNLAKGRINGGLDIDIYTKLINQPFKRLEAL